MCKEREARLTAADSPLTAEPSRPVLSVAQDHASRTPWPFQVWLSTTYTPCCGQRKPFSPPAPLAQVRVQPSSPSPLSPAARGHHAASAANVLEGPPQADPRLTLPTARSASCPIAELKQSPPWSPVALGPSGLIPHPQAYPRPCGSPCCQISGRTS